MIIDFTDKQFDDQNKMREFLTKTLRELESKIINSSAVPKGTILYMVQTDKMTIPNGFAKADGQHKTFDANNETLIPIQKI